MPEAYAHGYLKCYGCQHVGCKNSINGWSRQQGHKEQMTDEGGEAIPNKTEKSPFSGNGYRGDATFGSRHFMCLPDAFVAHLASHTCFTPL
jgi:hypothetical protein